MTAATQHQKPQTPRYATWKSNPTSRFQPRCPKYCGHDYDKAQLTETQHNWLTLIPHNRPEELATDDHFQTSNVPDPTFQAIHSNTLRLRATDGFGLSLVDWIMPYGIADGLASDGRTCINGTAGAEETV